MTKKEALEISIKAGANPDCVHLEDIVGQIGTCRKCGRVVQYPFWDPFMAKGKK